MSGDYTGHDEVVGFFQALGERSNGTFHLGVHDILENNKDTVVVHPRETQVVERAVRYELEPAPA